jgi:flavodoxin
MHTLVIYYSKSGRTRSVAKSIAQELNADIEEIRETGGQRSVIRTMFGAILGRRPEVEKLSQSVEAYDLVAIGTPVWGGGPVPAVESFLGSVDLGDKAVALFCTMGGSGDAKTFAKMESFLKDSRVVGRLSLNRSQTADPSTVDEHVHQWLKDLTLHTDSD